jgi:hypothetical protein
MSIKPFSYQEMLALTGENPATVRNDRRHGQTVAAFGAAEPSSNNKWLLVDCVAMLIRDQLVELGMRRKMAAIIVRAFFDHWVEALSKVEHQGRSMLFATADLGGKRMWTAFGSEDKFSAFQELLPEDEPPKRLYTVKLGEIMDGIRHRAQKADIHLGSFFLPPEHPFFIKCTTEFRAAREKALNQFDPLRKPPRGPSERERQAFEDTLCTI